MTGKNMVAKNIKLPDRKTGMDPINNIASLTPGEISAINGGYGILGTGESLAGTIYAGIYQDGNR